MNCPMISGDQPPISTYAEWHLGDNLTHLLFLRKAAQANPDRAFGHYCQPGCLWQLLDFVDDVPNLKLFPLDQKPHGAINSHKCDGDYFWTHPKRYRYVDFTLEWFDRLAGKLGVSNPITTSRGLLFDNPCIQRDCGIRQPVDVLVVNGAPKSEQFKPWTPDYFDTMIAALMKAGHSVMTTTSNFVGAPCALMTVAQLANLSLRVKAIVGVGTGPIFPMWNVWNVDTVKTRLVMLDNGETLNGLGGHYADATTRERAMDILKNDAHLI
jgi:hypothetical protein